MTMLGRAAIPTVLLLLPVLIVLTWRRRAIRGLMRGRAVAAASRAAVLVLAAMLRLPTVRGRLVALLAWLAVAVALTGLITCRWCGACVRLAALRTRARVAVILALLVVMAAAAHGTGETAD